MKKTYPFFLLLSISILFFNCKKDKIEKSANDIILTQIFECEKNIHTININYTNDLKKLNLSNFFSIDRIKKDINNIESSKIFEEYKDIEKIYFESLKHQIENIESYINKLEPSKNLDIEKIEIYRYRLDNLNTELKEIKKLSKESLSIIEKYLKLTKKCNYKIINDNLVFEDEICNLEFLSLSVTFLSYEINESRYKKSIENINYRILD